MRVDNFRISQAILNLLSNAVKFTPKNGKIDISIVEDDESVQFKIKDNGKGLTPEEIQKLFGKATKKQVATNLQDITSVKELFDKLYRASENPEILSSLKPSMDNVMFGKLNRAKTINDNFTL